MQLPIQPAYRGRGPSPAEGLLQDPIGFNEVFLGAFRRDLLSFYPGCHLEHEPILTLAGLTPAPPRVSTTFDFQLDESDEAGAESVRVSLFGNWYRLSVPGTLGLGRAIANSSARSAG